mgnify:CR=1 FL=1
MMSGPHRRGGRGQQGIALITILLLLVFMLAIIAGLFYRHQLHIQKVSRMLVGEQAMLLFLGAESWARRVLSEDGRQTRIDHLEEKWAYPLPPMPMEGGVLTGCLRDEQGLFSLNSLGWYTSKTWAEELAGDGQGRNVTSRRRILQNLMAQAGLEHSDALVASLVDWVDPDGWLVSPESAEDNEYLLMQPPYRAANFPLGDIDELTLVSGFSPAFVERLEPLVNTVPGDLPLNVNTASVPVLAAVSSLVSVEQARRLAGLRPFPSLDKFYEQMASVVSETHATLRTLVPPQFLTVSSDYFSVHARLVLAGSDFAYRSLIWRRGDTTRVLSRTLTPIPQVVNDPNRKLPPVIPCGNGNNQESL